MILTVEEIQKRFPDLHFDVMLTLADLQSRLAAKDAEIGAAYLRCANECPKTEVDGSYEVFACDMRETFEEWAKEADKGAALAEEKRRAKLEAYERCRDEAAKNLYNGDEGAEDLRQLFAKWIALETPAGEKV